jgi:hypothetical protein
MRDPGVNFSRIRDELSFWLLELAPETMRTKKKKPVFKYHPPFM